MASLFEERALLDLVRGLKTLRGGLAVALCLAARHRSAPVLCRCRLCGARVGVVGVGLVGRQILHAETPQSVRQDSLTLCCSHDCSCGRNVQPFSPKMHQGVIAFVLRLADVVINILFF